MKNKLNTEVGESESLHCPCEIGRPEECLEHSQEADTILASDSTCLLCGMARDAIIHSDVYAGTHHKFVLRESREHPEPPKTCKTNSWCVLFDGHQGNCAGTDVFDLLREIDKWCSGENQVEDGEDAEDALRYIQDAIKAFLAGDMNLL